ncbi:MAG: extracellular solute-binding protein [Christensenellaceae bacterium]|jgi:spermidine/putrescine transport system substrate-binding protein|nr:extracellular solute-binding protein [Christensenellaceae bacterium]
MKKRFLVLILSIAVVLGGSLGLIFTFQTPRGEVIKIINWEDYINPDLITQFEEETGYKIQYDTFSDNEELYTKIKEQKLDYDLAFPSDYMADKLKNDGLIKEEYTTEYFWGVLGIMYDSSKLPEDFFEIYPDFTALFEATDHKGRISMKKSARDSVGAAMLYAFREELKNGEFDVDEVFNMQGFDIENAEFWLEHQGINMSPVYENDEGKFTFIDSEGPYDFGLYWSCDYTAIIDSEENTNENLEFYVPRWTNFWHDNIVVPKYAQNENGAAQFINFLKEHEQENFDYIGYPFDDENYPEFFDEDPDYYAYAIMQDFEIEKESTVNSLMINIMVRTANAQKQNLLWLWILLGVIGTGLAEWFVWWIFNRRKAT